MELVSINFVFCYVMKGGQRLLKHTSESSFEASVITHAGQIFPAERVR